MRGDPTGSFAVTNQGMQRISWRIGRFALPTLIVQEGGYWLGDLRAGAHAFFRGIIEPGTTEPIVRRCDPGARGAGGLPPAPCR